MSNALADFMGVHNAWLLVHGTTGA